MTVHVINLDRDTGRLETFLTMHAHVPDIVRIRGVEGKSVDRKSLQMLGVISEDLTYTDGPLGCALSHIRLWRRVLNEKRVFTIVEDDAILARNFQPAHDRMLAKLPKDWDIMLWGWNFDQNLWTEIPEGVAPSILRFDQDALRKNIEIFRSSDVRSSAFRLHHAFGTMGYSLSPTGARALLEICLPLAKVDIYFDNKGLGFRNNGIDCMMNAAYRRIKAYVCIPPLVVSENRHEVSRTVAED